MNLGCLRSGEYTDARSPGSSLSARQKVDLMCTPVIVIMTLGHDPKAKKPVGSWCV
jgi:hypothetical protein